MDTALPLIRATMPGLYQVLANANTDYPVQIPSGAVGVFFWFETSPTNPLVIGGRAGVDQTATLMPGMDNTDPDMGYHPAGIVQYEFQTADSGGETLNPNDLYLHLACATAGAVVRGTWLFVRDTGQ